VFAQQALEWGLVNHLVTAEELLPKAVEIAQNMCNCVPHILKQYKALIDEGYNKPYREALAWEEQRAIASAGEIMASTIASRRESVLEQGRSEKNDR
jgi:enoyl-CoA hydratase